MPNQEHIPVLLTEVLDCLQPQVGETYLDLTAGYGGHAAAVIKKTDNPKGAVLVDRDLNAVAYLKDRFRSSEVLETDFVAALVQLDQTNRQFDLILADLGVSSPHLENSDRGFSLKQSGPLDMRMDQSQALTADQVVNSYSQEDLANILRQYGQEPKARQIARNIVQNRPIRSTAELAALVAKSWPGHSRQHPATRTFQAIRIAVNDELNQIKQALPIMLKLLKPGGRVAIISFHSLEDRLVKDLLKDNSGNLDSELVQLTKKPLLATKTEIVSNPRARSAKLRAAAKIKNKIEGKKGKPNAY